VADIEKLKKDNSIVIKAGEALATDPERLPEEIRKLQKEIKEITDSIKRLK
jgi:uncharacterized protein (UPF0335 family)